MVGERTSRCDLPGPCDAATTLVQRMHGSGIGHLIERVAADALMHQHMTMIRRVTSVR
ncbi:Uncharacterised protein [Mycobacteroides abscessus subsp. massiliense]|nr:Uncharacterised protein [Mycobacteroides abscessus subsp. massiliense]